MVGLGRMGSNMARRLMKAGHECVVYNRSQDKVRELVSEGAEGAASFEEIIEKLPKPRAVWVMVPAGDVTESTVKSLAALLSPGDVIIDGGNSNFHDDVRRAKMVAEKGIDYLDIGTSGGVWGLERGYCLMIGGPKRAVDRLDPIFKALAPGNSGIAPSTPKIANNTAVNGYLHCGDANGSGHYVKMIHNGIEYGVMQAYAEGFDILKNASKDDLPEDIRYPLDLPAIAELWRRGSVVGSWLLDLTAISLQQDPQLSQFTGFVQDSGEGRWTIEAAIQQGTPAEVLTSALYTRFRSRIEHTFAEKVLSAMRSQFGGHKEPK